MRENYLSDGSEWEDGYKTLTCPEQEPMITVKLIDDSVK